MTGLSILPNLPKVCVLRIIHVLSHCLYPYLVRVRSRYVPSPLRQYMNSNIPLPFFSLDSSSIAHEKVDIIPRTQLIRKSSALSAPSEIRIGTFFYLTIHNLLYFDYGVPCFDLFGAVLCPPPDRSLGLEFCPSRKPAIETAFGPTHQSKKSFHNTNNNLTFPPDRDTFFHFHFFLSFNSSSPRLTSNSLSTYLDFLLGSKEFSCTAPLQN